MNLMVPTHLLEAYAVANTPAFLYKALRDDPYVARLRAAFSVDELKDNLAARKQQDRSLNAVVAAYCQLVAGFQLTSDSTKQLALVESARLPWSERLLAQHRVLSSTSNGPVQRLARVAVATANEVTFEFNR